MIIRLIFSYSIIKEIYRGDIDVSGFSISFYSVLE